MNLAADHSLAILGAAGVLLLLLWQFAWRLTRLAGRSARTLAGRLPRSRVWARTGPLRSALARRFPRSYGFLAARLDPRDFTGLPLTLLAAAALYVASLLAGQVEALLEAEEMVRLDRAVNDFFADYRSPLLVMLLGWLTDLGGSAALLGVAIVATGFIWAHRRPHLILPLWVCYGGSGLTTWSGKFVFARERPEFVTGVTALSPSFPSAHATGTLAVYGFVAYAIARDLSGLRGRFEVTFWTLVVVALVGFSRVFLSVHYLSDVLTGFLVGTFWLLVGFAIGEYGRARGARAAEPGPAPPTQKQQ